MTVYDAIVVGAGVEGLFTAYHLAKSNNKTLLLEQFPLPHSRGSSHGQSRIIRKAYTKQYYADMMPEAYSQWSDLEKAANTELLVTTGLLCMGSTTTSVVRDSSQALKRLGSPHEDLTPTQLRRKFPMMRFYNDMEAVYDPEAGILRADRVLQALTNQFIKSGGTLQDGEPVTKVTPGQTVTVATSKGQYQAKSVVLCTGPWTSKLVTPLGVNLPLQPIRVAVYYWKCRLQQYSAQHGFPTLIYDDEEKHLYGLPALEYPNHIKLCAHAGPDIDPDARDAVSPDTQLLDLMAKFIRKHIPGVEDKPSITETCIYTMTPDDDFILDTHPQWKNIVIGAGFSGHGFKLAPIVGKVLSELATGRRLSYSLDPFRLDRFPKVATSKL